jgi:hypothetical protein
MSDLYTMKRGWMEHPLFAGEEYTRALAWEWLVSHAAWKETKTFAKGKSIPIQRGQLSYSVRFMAQKWGWKPARAQRFLQLLSQEGMIKTCSKIDTASDTTIDTGQLVITICNYSEYQLTPKLTDTTSDTVTDTAAIQQRYKEEEGNKEILTKHAREGKPEKVSLEALSLAHIAEWLAEKRAGGKYVLHDEKAVLETFKNYCHAKDPKYKDYVAALRNSFDWERNQPRGSPTLVAKKPMHPNRKIV